MLAQHAAMPRRTSSYAYEPKWDGFRAMLRTEYGLRVLSRRRWNMTPLRECRRSRGREPPVDRSACRPLASRWRSWRRLTEGFSPADLKALA
jgi:hypothetical protein